MPRRFTCLLILVIVLVAISNSHAAHRNVLLLISDNQNWDDCGCYGNDVIQTPNLDSLAQQGIRFTHAFATTASCGPSRGVIYSGLYTHDNGQYGHGHGYHNYILRPHVVTIYQSLKAAGYRTALIGKDHVGPKTQYPIDFQPRTSNYDVLLMAKHAREFMAADDTKPFFLTVAYSDPHPTGRDGDGWGVRRKFDENAKVPTYSPDDVKVPSYLPDRPDVRAGLAGYYQQISRLDAGIGQVLRDLKETGHDDDTLVIFTSDHGSSEPGAMSNHYDPGIRVPFIVRRPGEPNLANVVNDAMITLADITPTIADWTQADKPKYAYHGRSILPVLDGKNTSEWDEVVLSHVCHEVTMYYPMRTIRTRRYKLIWNIAWRLEYPLPIDTLERKTWVNTLKRGDKMIGPRTIDKFLFRDEIELYDLQRDPDEIVNVADKSGMAKVRAELSAKLLERLQETKDPWLLRHSMPLPRR